MTGGCQRMPNLPQIQLGALESPLRANGPAGRDPEDADPDEPEEQIPPGGHAADVIATKEACIAPVQRFPIQAFRGVTHSGRGR